MSQGPPPVIINPRKNHISTVIFLHGLGDSGDGWSDVFAHEIRHDNTKYICPSSASRPVTLNMGMRMPAWFDLFGLDANAREDSEGIAQATRLVHGMIDSEVSSGIPSEKIILGGFSMGGALALYAGLTYPYKLGGIIGLSSFLIQRDKLPGNHTANRSTPILLGHGSNDILVPLTFGQLTESLIKAFNPNVRLLVYNGMGHSSCAEELRDVKRFIDEKVNL
ncbi:putative acyl-protein thioesterase 1 [Dictyocaulus viviparus]|uniref:palmitoyl-protein hydrolase n=1 Tax=Dictyocaulus viviparus TaxID=29172 RepID=A0A0D8Y6A4_DICVI|nr:putative acyl-protein thioesterase 1 [Dictyocaulus viviparus]